MEDEIYRIDHFLGKDTVQNIFSLRFSNIIFEGVWNRSFIDHVQIVALEDVDADNRIEFYDKVGHKGHAPEPPFADARLYHHLV